MPGFRGPQSARQANQLTDNQLQFAGTPMTWKHWVSAGGGNPTGGLGPSAFYVQQTITGLTNNYQIPEALTQAGLFTSGMVMLSTREKMSRNDVLMIDNSAYRVYSDPVFSPINNTWQCTLRKGN